MPSTTTAAAASLRLSISEGPYGWMGPHCGANLVCVCVCVRWEVMPPGGGGLPGAIREGRILCAEDQLLVDAQIRFIWRAP